MRIALGKNCYNTMNVEFILFFFFLLLFFGSRSNKNITRNYTFVTFIKPRSTEKMTRISSCTQTVECGALSKKKLNISFLFFFNLSAGAPPFAYRKTKHQEEITQRMKKLKKKKDSHNRSFFSS